MKRVIFITTLLICLSINGASAAQFDDAKAALNRNDYATAVTFFVH